MPPATYGAVQPTKLLPVTRVERPGGGSTLSDPGLEGLDTNSWHEGNTFPVHIAKTADATIILWIFFYARVRRNGGGGDRERAPAPAFRADKAGTAGVDGGDAQAAAQKKRTGGRRSLFASCSK